VAETHTVLLIRQLRHAEQLAGCGGVLEAVSTKDSNAPLFTEILYQLITCDPLEAEMSVDYGGLGFQSKTGGR
jgi:hypothetical protein